MAPQKEGTSQVRSEVQPFLMMETNAFSWVRHALTFQGSEATMEKERCLITHDGIGHARLQKRGLDMGTSLDQQASESGLLPEELHPGNQVGAAIGKGGNGEQGILAGPPSHFGNR